MIVYYVYNNWAHKYVRIHKAECCFCNDGHGSHKKISGEYDEWKGPFTKDEAELEAQKTKRKTISKCSRCL